MNEAFRVVRPSELVNPDIPRLTTAPSRKTLAKIGPLTDFQLWSFTSTVVGKSTEPTEGTSVDINTLPIVSAMYNVPILQSVSTVGGEQQALWGWLQEVYSLHYTEVSKEEVVRRIKEIDDLWTPAHTGGKDYVYYFLRGRECLLEHVYKWATGGNWPTVEFYGEHLSPASQTLRDKQARFSNNPSENRFLHENLSRSWVTAWAAYWKFPIPKAWTLHDIHTLAFYCHYINYSKSRPSKPRHLKIVK